LWRPFSNLPHRVALVGAWLDVWLASCHRGYCVPQVVDTGVNRKFANEVPVYLGSAANGGNQAPLDPVANTERGMNLRFKHTSRR